MVLKAMTSLTVMYPFGQGFTQMLFPYGHILNPRAILRMLRAIRYESIPPPPATPPLKAQRVAINLT